MDLYATLIRNTGAKDAIAIWKENSDFFFYIPILSDKSVLYQAWLLETVTICQMCTYIYVYKLYCSEKNLWKKIMVQSHGQSHRRFSYLGKERLASMMFFSDMELHISVSRNSKSDTCINCWYTAGFYFHGTCLHGLKKTYSEWIRFTIYSLTFHEIF